MFLVALSLLDSAPRAASRRRSQARRRDLPRRTRSGVMRWGQRGDPRQGFCRRSRAAADTPARGGEASRVAVQATGLSRPACAGEGPPEREHRAIERASRRCSAAVPRSHTSAKRRSRLHLSAEGWRRDAAHSARESSARSALSARKRARSASSPAPRSRTRELRELESDYAGSRAIYPPGHAKTRRPRSNARRSPGRRAAREMRRLCERRWTRAPARVAPRSARRIDCFAALGVAAVGVGPDDSSLVARSPPQPLPSRPPAGPRAETHRAAALRSRTAARPFARRR
jgi:hypothetical protein